MLEYGNIFQHGVSVETVRRLKHADFNRYIRGQAHGVLLSLSPNSFDDA